MQYALITAHIQLRRYGAKENTGLRLRDGRMQRGISCVFAVRTKLGNFALLQEN